MATRQRKIIDESIYDAEHQEDGSSLLKRRAHLHIDLYMTLALMEEPEFLRICSAAGIPQETWAMVFGSRIWKLQDHKEVRECLDTLLQGRCTEVGIPPINFPAEVICAFLVTCVNRVNWEIACYWYQNANTAQQIMRASASEPTMFRPGLTVDQLVAMCQSMAGPDFRPWRDRLRAALVASQGK